MIVVDLCGETTLKQCIGNNGFTTPSVAVDLSVKANTVALNISNYRLEWLNTIVNVVRFICSQHIECKC